MVGGEVQSKIWGGPQGPGAAGVTPPGTAEEMLHLRERVLALTLERDDALSTVGRLEGVNEALREQRDEARQERDRANGERDRTNTARHIAVDELKRAQFDARKNETAARLGAQLLEAAAPLLKDALLSAAAAIREASGTQEMPF